MSAYTAKGQKHHKLRAGFLSEDERNIAARAASLLPDDGAFMIDANQSWDLATTTETLRPLEDLSPAFAEEPLRADADPTAWENLVAATSIPLAGGKELYGVDQFMRYANAGLRVVQPDVAKWGGITGALDLARALPEGMKIWLHFMGTPVSQMAAANLTAVLAGMRFARWT